MPAATWERSSRAPSPASRESDCLPHPKIEEVARGSFRRKAPPEIAGSGYVVRSLEAALWALDRTETFRDGALLGVNLGDDADTTGAVSGQLAGAISGEDAHSCRVARATRARRPDPQRHSSLRPFWTAAS